jgi:hypothetical protein
MQMNEMFVALGVPLGAFFMAVAIVALVGYFNQQARRQRAELIKLALERGQPLPAGLLDPPGQGRSDLRQGIQTIFVGIGLGVFLLIFKPEKPLWAVGLMIVIFGLGKLASHAAGRRQAPPAPGGPAT